MDETVSFTFLARFGDIEAKSSVVVVHREFGMFRYELGGFLMIHEVPYIVAFGGWGIVQSKRGSKISHTS